MRGNQGRQWEGGIRNGKNVVDGLKAEEAKFREKWLLSEWRITRGEKKYNNSVCGGLRTLGLLWEGGLWL